MPEDFWSHYINAEKMKAVTLLALLLSNLICFSREGTWSVHLDAEHKESVQSILHAKAVDQRTDNLLNFGFTKQAIWISRSINMPIGGAIFVNNPLIKQSDFFLAVDGKVIKEAHFTFLRNLETDKVPNSILLFEVPAGFNGTLVMRFRSTEALVIPLELVEAADIYKGTTDKLVLGYLIAGAMFSLVFLYLVYFVALRDKVYLFYFIYAVTVIVTVLRLNGLLYYWFPASRVFDNYSSIFETLPTLTAGIFTLQFLQVRSFFPRMAKVIMAFVIGQAISLIITFAGYNTLAFIVTDIIAFSFIPLAMGLSYYTWRVKKYEPALYYIVSWVFVFTGAILYFTRNYGLWQSELPIANHTIDLGIAVEMLLLALGLAKRVEYLRREKETLQMENIKILNEKKQELELLVTERTKDLEAQNQEILKQQYLIESANSTLEKTVKERTEQLEVRNKKLIEYAYFNAHEVRGPLARILGLAYLVKSRPEDNPLDMIEKIEFSANELDKVIRDINQSLSNEERR